MSSSTLVDREPPAVVNRGATAAPIRKSRLHPKLRLPLLLVLNLTIHSLLLTAVSQYLNNELGAVSRTGDKTTYEILGVIGSKVAILLFGWWFSLDFVEVSAVTIVANSPYYYLLATYYDVSAATIATILNIELFAIALPTYLLQRRSAVHDSRVKIRNRYLLESFQVQHSTNILSIAVFVTLVWVGQQTGKLNEWLITWFEIPTVERAHQETVVSIALKVFTAGLATKAFLLNPSIAAETVSGAATPTGEFDPATADLQSTLRHNFWFFSTRTRLLIRNTVILSLITLVNTVQRTTSLKGTTYSGAASYGGLWIGAILLDAAWMAWIGDTSV